jgi:hypothetical protein
VVTASPRTVPDEICAFAVVDTPTNICTVPLTVPIMAAFTSRYGTCTTFTPADLFKVSQARCGTVPMPADAQLRPPGRDFARATSSATERAGTLGCTTSA